MRSSIDMYNNDVGKKSAQKFMYTTMREGEREIEIWRDGGREKERERGRQAESERVRKREVRRGACMHACVRACVRACLALQEGHGLMRDLLHPNL
jgi:predicted metal-binding protein